MLDYRSPIHGGMELVPSPFMTIHKQFRFPRSGKSRIQKKWRKRWQNWRHLPSPTLAVAGGKVFGHPTTLEKWTRKLKAVAG